jgi:hypothetical protein
VRVVGRIQMQDDGMHKHTDGSARARTTRPLQPPTPARQAARSREDARGTRAGGRRARQLRSTSEWLLVAGALPCAALRMRTVAWRAKGAHVQRQAQATSNRIIGEREEGSVCARRRRGRPGGGAPVKTRPTMALRSGGGTHSLWGRGRSNSLGCKAPRGARCARACLRTVAGRRGAICRRGVGWGGGGTGRPLVVVTRKSRRGAGSGRRAP